MDGLKRFLMIGAILATLTPAPAPAQLTATAVRDSLAQATSFIASRQAADGSWGEWPGQKGGITALVTLALIEAGTSVDSPVIDRALTYLRALRPEDRRVYATSLTTMALCRALPERDRVIIGDHVRWLEAAQITSGPGAGGWSYRAGDGRPDNSNSQFALLALHEAVQVGITVSPDVWQGAANYWLAGQHNSGGWGYEPRDPPSGSMTCAGISSLIIIEENMARVPPKSINDFACCSQEERSSALEQALAYWGTKFSAKRNPTGPNDVGDSYLYYYLYGVERAGRLSGTRFFGEHDWYREGAEHLLTLQRPVTGGWIGSKINPAESQPEIASAFALLFLAKGRWPVLAAEYRHDTSPTGRISASGLTYLIRDVEKAWKRNVTWQVIESDRASADDLLQSPVLLIAGRDSLKLDARRKEALRQYVQQGGFIFAWADSSPGCDATGFDTDFRNLMAEIFPESSLDPLPPEHPIWRAQSDLIPDPNRPLLGIQACCRTSIVYCPADLDCRWRWGQATQRATLAPEVRDDVDAALAIGVNVLTYATGRSLKDKLERPRLAASIDERSRFRLEIPKLAHGGGADEAAAAWNNLLREAGRWLDQPLLAPAEPLAPDDPALSSFPLVFVHGRRDFQFQPAEREALSRFLGPETEGFIFADAICGSKEFADAVRREIQAIRPEGKWRRLEAEHPLLSEALRGFDLSRVTLRRPDRSPDGAPTVRESRAPAQLEAFEIDGRIAVILSPFDLSCAWESGSGLECEGYAPDDAVRIGINVLLYALQE